MNRKLLFVLPLSWLLAGCAEPTSDESVCEEYTGPEHVCSPEQNPQAPHVNLNAVSLMVNPWCVRANPGTTLVFMLTPKNNNTLGSAKIFPKDEDNTWLKGTNDADKDEIRIPVPATLTPGPRDYGFVVGDKCVDPRVSVED